MKRTVAIKVVSESGEFTVIREGESDFGLTDHEIEGVADQLARGYCCSYDCDTCHYDGEMIS